MKSLRYREGEDTEESDEDPTPEDYERTNMAIAQRQCDECGEGFEADYRDQGVCNWCREHTCDNCGYSIRAHASWCSSESYETTELTADND